MGYAHKLQNVMWYILFSFGFPWFFNQLCLGFPKDEIISWVYFMGIYIKRIENFVNGIYSGISNIRIRLWCVDVFWWSTHKFSLHTSLGKWKIEITWKPKRFRDMHNYVYTCAYLSMRHKIQQWCIIEQST